jgi:nucleoside-diphosphate-sugar epimerase
MKIAIIGCGYLGNALGLFWKDCGHSITTTTRSPKKACLLAQIFDRADIFTSSAPETLVEVIKDQEVIVLSVAADNHDTYASTYLATAKALAFAATKASNLKRIFYTSSTSVYGDRQGASVDESSTLFPLSRSSQILVETESTLLSLETPRRSVCIFRLGEIYGPSRRIDDRLSQLNGRPLPGTGDNLTNLIHLEDIIRAIDFALSEGLTGVYNLCNDLHIPRRQLYERLCQQLALPLVQWDPTQKSLHSGNKLVLNQKIKAAGYWPKILDVG